MYDIRYHTGTSTTLSNDIENEALERKVPYIYYTTISITLPRSKTLVDKNHGYTAETVHGTGGGCFKGVG